jgi:hypothetical protein
MSNQSPTVDFMSAYAKQLLENQKKGISPPYKPPAPKPIVQPQPAKVPSPGISRSMNRLTLKEAQAEKRTPISQPKDFISGYTEQLIKNTPNKPVTNEQRFRYIDQMDMKKQAAAQTKPAYTSQMTPDEAIADLTEKIDILSYFDGKSDAGESIMSFTQQKHSLEALKDNLQKANNATKDAYMAQPALLSDSEKLARYLKSQINDYDLNKNSTTLYGTGITPPSITTLEKQYNDFITSDHHIQSNWDYWNALATGDRVLTSDERAQVQDAIDALYARLERDGLNQPVPDNIDIGLGNTGVAWTKELRDEQVKYLSLIGALSSKVSGVYAAGSGLAMSMPFAESLSNWIDSNRAKSITDGDSAYQSMMADSDTVANAQNTFPGAYQGGNLFGTTLMTAAGGAGLSAAGVKSALAADSIANGLLSGAHSAEHQDWSDPWTASLNTGAAFFGNAALVYGGGKLIKSLDDMIRDVWYSEGTPVSATGKEWPETYEDLIASNGGASYTDGAGNNAYNAYIKILNELEQAKNSGMTAREFAMSKGVPSSLTDEEAAFLDKYGYKLFSEGAAKLPQGIDKQSFATASQLIRGTVGDISDDIVVQGSRAAGTASAASDIDFAIRVSQEQFDNLIKQYFKTPNPGSAAERTLLRAIQSGKIQSGEAKLSGLRIILEKQFGMKVDISIILKGGPFDNGTIIRLP